MAAIIQIVLVSLYGIIQEHFQFLMAVMGNHILKYIIVKIVAAF
eukprot:02641.XXX_223_354_1 [CDS] Oithona nana genome sequencing.